MTQPIRWFLPMLFATLTACSTSQGFDRAGMQETLNQRLHIAPEHETKGLTNRIPALAAPFRLGVYFVRTESPTRQSVRPVEWLSAEKTALMQRLAQLHSGQIVRETVILAESTVLNLTRQEFRQAAIRYGIDVLLLIDGIGAVDRHNNAYSLLYPTIIGAYLVPGTVSDALFVIDGRLWDLRTDTVGERQTAEGLAHLVGAAVMVEDADALREAKGQAIAAFGEKLADHLRSLQQGVENAPPPRP